VECQSLDEGIEAATAGADIVMLDNFSSISIHDTARQIKAKFPHILIEASGVRESFLFVCFLLSVVCYSGN
jgi:nicotinate-nucleotide pyrophosphorylase (carboxylating)